MGIHDETLCDTELWLRRNGLVRLLRIFKATHRALSNSKE